MWGVGLPVGSAAARIGASEVPDASLTVRAIDDIIVRALSKTAGVTHRLIPDGCLPRRGLIVTVDLTGVALTTL